MPGPLPQPCACLAEEGRGQRHPYGSLCSPCCSAGGSWHLGEGTGASRGRYWFLEVDVKVMEGVSV